MSEEKEFDAFKKYIEQYLVGEEKQITAIYTGIKVAHLTNTVPAFLLQGPPGAGKTYVTKLIAEYLNAEYVFLQATLNTSEDELIYKYIPSENSKSGVKILYGPLPEALKKSYSSMTVLVIDEFDKTRPSADALLLDFLQNARISYRLDDNQEVIEGNRNNLIVFLTSNENREFSEPLLRRLIVVDFLPPSPKAVETLLSKEFDKKTVKLLSKLYVAGLHAGLTKPITIQELLQFGKALEIMPNASFNDLVYSFLVKNQEDMTKLETALRQTETEQTQAQEGSPDVAQALLEQAEQEQQEQEPQEEEEEQKETVQKVLASIKIPKDEVINAEKITNEEERTFLTSISPTFTEYSDLVKTFEPAPSERPDVLGKFQAVLVGTNLNLTASTPLTLLETYRLLLQSQMQFESYIEDKVYISYETIIQIAKSEKLNITYYTKNLILLKKNETIIRLEKIKDKYFVLRMYVNVKNANESKQLIGHILNFQEDFVLTHLLGNIEWKYKEIMNGKYFNTEEFQNLKEFLETTQINAKMIIATDKELYFTFTKGTEINVEGKTITNNNSITFTITRIDMSSEKKELANNIQNILNKYVGTYNLLEGLNKLKEMADEIQNLVSNND